MFNIRLIKGEKGMLELKGGGKVHIHTGKNNLKAEEAFSGKKGQ